MGEMELATVHEALALEAENGSTQRVNVEIARAMRVSQRVIRLTLGGKSRRL